MEEVIQGKADLEEKFLKASYMCSLFSAQHLPTWIQNDLSTYQLCFSHFSIYTGSPYKELPASCPSPAAGCTPGQVERRAVPAGHAEPI